MWCAVVGSRTFGQCPCLASPIKLRGKHLEVCPALHAFKLVMATVTRLARYPDFEGIVSGGAPGADTLAKQACQLLGVKLLELKPSGGREPFAVRAKARNTKIVEKAALVVAFFGPGAPSPGTSDTLTKARAAGKPTFVWHSGSWRT
jgi:hypothetical protein